MAIRGVPAAPVPELPPQESWEIRLDACAHMPKITVPSTPHRDRNNVFKRLMTPKASKKKRGKR